MKHRNTGSQPRRFRQIRGDLAGGVASAMVALPGNIVYGTIAFAPLGPEFAGKGILAGMFSSVFAGLLAAVFGGTRAMVTGPQAPTALVFGSTIGQLIASGLLHPARDGETILTLLFGAAFLGGILQILFGLFKLGKSAKFIPYPVIAGILTGTGLLILQSQFWILIGTPRMPLGELIRHPSLIQPWTVLVALVTAALMARGPGWISRIPGSILGIAGGTAVYYALVLSGVADRIGPTLDAIPSALPAPVYLGRFFPVFSNPSHWPLLSILATAALTMAVLSSIDSLLSSVSMQSYTQQRSETDVELRAQGIGTLAASLFGGLPGTGYTNRSIVNFESGGRTRLSGVVHSLSILLFVLLLAPLIEKIPQAVMSGVILVTGFLIMDKATLKLLGSALRGKMEPNGEIRRNAAIVVLVALVTLLFGLMAAVAAGMLVSVLILLVQMSKSTIRGVLDGSRIRSNHRRNPQLTELLNTHGGKIAIIELEGSLFFGSADNLAVEMERLSSRGVLFFILDMKRVNRLDSTAAKIIEQTGSRLQRQQRTVTLSYIREGGRLWRFIRDFGLDRSIPPDHCFADTHHALEFCEDRLLASVAPDHLLDDTRLTLNELLGLNRVAVEKAMMIADYIDRESYRAGERIFRQGDPADALYFISRGKAAITVDIPATQRVRQLQTLDFGTYFGEMALFGETRRAVNVEAMENLACFRIGLDKYAKMQRECPDLALAIVDTISRTLASRLQDAYRMISELER